MHGQQNVKKKMVTLPTRNLAVQTVSYYFSAI